MSTHEVASTHAPAPEHHTSTGLDNTKLAMWAFLGSECLFFGSFITTYLLYRNRSYLMAGAYLLVYSYTGLSSLGHYVYGSGDDFTARMHASILADAVAGALVALCGVAVIVRSRTRSRLA